MRKISIVSAVLILLFGITVFLKTSTIYAQTTDPRKYNRFEDMVRLFRLVMNGGSQKLKNNFGLIKTFGDDVDKTAYADAKKLVEEDNFKYTYLLNENGQKLLKGDADVSKNSDGDLIYEKKERIILEGWYALNLPYILIDEFAENLFSGVTKRADIIKEKPVSGFYEPLYKDGIWTGKWIKYYERIGYKLMDIKEFILGIYIDEENNRAEVDILLWIESKSHEGMFAVGYDSIDGGLKYNPRNKETGKISIKSEIKVKTDGSYRTIFESGSNAEDYISIIAKKGVKKSSIQDKHGDLFKAF